MFFKFTFRKFLTHPYELAEQLKSSTMRGFKVRLLLVFLAGLFLYGARELWGMSTESITPVLSTMSTADYTLARFSSLISSLLWAVIYMSFYIFGFAYILAIITSIPFKKLLPLQVLMMGILLIEKLIVFVVFVMQGAATNVSFLSFGPLAATFLEIPFFIFFFNKLTVMTAIIIALQFKFILSYTGFTKHKKLLWTLIIIHVFMAVVTASVGLIPMENLFELLTGRGAGNA